ncbi:MAG: flagellar basal body rod protein FlgB [Oscillospiraceae bacterium]|nr:flagellar basal body rod protein FlgB [Oscillospiraceae bacterium]
MSLLGKVDRTTIIQEKSLDAAWLRNEVLSHNLANVDTPTYKRKDVDFEKYLRGALYYGLDDVIVNRRHNFRFTDPPTLDSIRPKVMEEYNTMAMRIDGNNVDIDEEMAQMAKNTIRYNVITQNLNGSFSKIKHAITEGRR